jgi:hypothetical protein
MFGSLGNLAGLIKSAKEMQGQIAKLQAELASRRYEADTGGGMVRAIVDGKGTLVEVKIDPQAAGDVELLEDLVRGAVCSAVTKSQEAMQGEMAELTGGLQLPPGLSDMLGGGKS